jgi:hypothetical protein
MTPDEACTQRTGISKLQPFVRWMFVSRRTGGIAVARWPNVALSAFTALSIARRFNIPNSTPETTLRLLSVLALIVWAADELARGVNPFRRILGLVVLLASFVLSAR